MLADMNVLPVYLEFAMLSERKFGGNPLAGGPKLLFFSNLQRFSQKKFDPNGLRGAKPQKR